MNKKEEIILMIVALLLAVLVGGLVFLYSGEEKQNIIGKAELTIDFGDGNKRAFEGEIVENETLIDALNQASKAGNFSSEEIILNKDKSWHWYLNDEKMDNLTDRVVLKSNDKILVKYE